MDTKRFPVTTLRAALSMIPVVAGLAASAMLVVNYVRPASVFCVEGGGCDSLKHTVFAMPLGVPLPLVGLVGFAAIGAWSLVAGRRARLVQLVLSAGAGLVGVMLVVLQVLLGHLCPYCLVADLSALLLLVVSALRLRDTDDVGWPVRAGGGGAMALAAGVPLIAGFHVNTTPQVIHDEIGRTPKGEVTIVDFVNFECPFCRMTHSEIEPILESHRERVRLVRRQVPLQMHPHARDAARAACCGEQMGKGDAMADALFTSEDLTPEGCEKIAERLGLPVAAFRDCVRSPATDASIDADKTEFKAAGGYALPTIWIDETPIVGAQGGEVVARALHDALARAGS